MNAFTGYFETCVWTHHDLHWGPSWCPPIHGHPLVDHMGHCPHRLYQNSPNWLGYKVSATDRQITNNRKNSYRKKKETRSNEMTRNGIKEHCLICTLCKFWVQYRVDGSVFNGRSWRHMFLCIFFIFPILSTTTLVIEQTSQRLERQYWVGLVAYAMSWGTDQLKICWIAQSCHHTGDVMGRFRFYGCQAADKSVSWGP